VNGIGVAALGEDQEVKIKPAIGKYLNSVGNDSLSAAWSEVGDDESEALCRMP
jgi:hypothetical protein